MFGAYRRGLRRVVGGAAVPYGYTLVISTSVGVLISTHGPPDALNAFLFLGGAIAGFAAAALVGGTGPEAIEVGGGLDRRLVGLSSGLAASAGLGATALAAHAFDDGRVAFLLR